MTSMICLAGKNRIAVDALLFMIERGWKDRLMICPNRTDKGSSDWQPSLVRFAKELEIKVLSLEQAQQIENLIFISLEFDRILRPSAFRSNRLYNIHFSALPAYKGMYTSALPILNGEKVSGVTLHEIDYGIDTGPIIAQKIFALPATWSARDLYFAYMKQGFDLFCQEFDRLIDKNPPVAKAQLAYGSTYYSKASIDYSNFSIDLYKTAEEVTQQLRANSFREYQTPMIGEMEIGNWHILPNRSIERPGTILERGPNHMVVTTIDYNIMLERSRFLEWFDLSNQESLEHLDTQNIDKSDRMGWTPLIKAVYAGETFLCQRLLEKGANPNKSNPNGTTPLMYAFSSRNTAQIKPIAKMLLKFGANPNLADFFGRDLLSYHPSSIVSIDL